MNAILGLRFAWSLVVLQAVLVPVFLDRGLSYIQIFSLQSLFSACLIVLELPTGVFADVFGRKPAIVLASIARGIGATILYYWPDYTGVLVSYVFIALGNSLVSGADISFLYESYRLQNKSRRSIKSYLAVTHFMVHVGGSIAALLGGYLASGSLDTAIYVNMWVAWLALAFAVALKEPYSLILVQTRSIQSRLRGISKALMSELRSSRRLRFTVGTIAICSCAPVVAMYGFQSIWKGFDLPLTWYGYIYAVQGLISGASATLVPRIHREIGHFLSLTILAATMVVGFGFASISNLWAALVGAALMSFVPAMSFVVMGDEVNKQVPDAIRASLNSLSNLVSRALVVVMSPLVGFVAQFYGMSSTFLLLALIFALCGALIILPLARMGPTQEMA